MTKHQYDTITELIDRLNELVNIWNENKNRDFEVKVDHAMAFYERIDDDR
jgi:hypothetical protein